MKQKYLLAYMDMTERFSETSEAERLKVGACLIKAGNPLAFGINGMPSGFPTNVCEDGSGKTKPEVNHAKINCLSKLRKLHETSIGATMLVTHLPCYPCALEIVDAGIVSVFYRHEYRCNKGLQYLLAKGVEVKQL